MGRVTLGPGYLIDEMDGDFICPICECPNKGEDWMDKFHKLKNPLGKIKCKGCKRKLNATFDLSGNAVIWE